jgi:phage terminase large subunit-like protein
VNAAELKAKLAGLSESDRAAAQSMLDALLKRKRERKFWTMYPDTGPYRRELYPKHLEFMSEGAHYIERCFLGANRSGKTVVGSFETVCHATGRYPPWWMGKRFDQPTRGWVAGDTAKTVRDIGQRELLGSPQQFGTGMIPGEDIIRATPKAGVPDAIDTIYVKHYDSAGEQDGVSEIGLKSYDQGRIAFQGTEQDYIWLDEECPMEVYIECLMRTMTTGGIIYLTFTPLRGITEVVLLFMPGGKTQ